MRLPVCSARVKGSVFLSAFITPLNFKKKNLCTENLSLFYTKYDQFYIGLEFYNDTILSAIRIAC